MMFKCSGINRFKSITISSQQFMNFTTSVSLSSVIMGVQSSEGQVMFSSIALLQQRFRELERIREKREERLLHVLAPRPAATASPREMPVKWFFHPELLYHAGRCVTPLPLSPPPPYSWPCQPLSVNVKVSSSTAIATPSRWSCGPVRPTTTNMSLVKSTSTPRCTSRLLLLLLLLKNVAMP